MRRGVGFAYRRLVTLKGTWVVNGTEREGIDILVPRTEPTVTVAGVLLYSDGKPVVSESVALKPDKTDDGIDGQSRGRTDEAGRFSIRILKGLTGTMYGEMFTYQGEFLNCAALEKLIRDSGRSMLTLRTNVVEIPTDDNLKNIELRYPFPGCVKRKT